MKKIVLIFDGANFSDAAFDFAYHMNSIEPILLTGVFLSSRDYATAFQYGFGGALVFTDWGLGEDDEQIAEKSIKRFESLCLNNGIDFRIHNGLGAYALTEINKESRFADLVIISSDLFYKNVGGEQPNEYMRSVLRDTECPIILVPEEKFQFPSSIILTYDGTEASVYAIKQYSYLFPEWRQKNTTLIYLGNDSIPDQVYIEELALRHFKNLTLFKIGTNTKNEFMTWLASQKNPLLIAGAFGRSGLSEFFRRSFISDIIMNYKTPVFIAHK